eukprot:1758325-Pleurochrysis_carterae.AAC.1
MPTCPPRLAHAYPRSHPRPFAFPCGSESNAPAHARAASRCGSANVSLSRVQARAASWQREEHGGGGGH